MQKSFFSVLFLTLFLFPLNSHATSKMVAKVVALRNSATATSLQGKIRTLTTKDPILEGDTIQTGKRGRIQILFTDNTIISLGRNANLSVHEYLWQPEQQNGVLHTEVKEGIFRVMGGAITKTNPEAFTTKTPAATIGIRGSMYAGRVSNNTLSVVFQGGRGIFIENSHGHVEIPTPGHGTNVRADQAPPPPIRFTSREIEALTPSTSPSGDEEPDTENTGTEPTEDGDTPPSVEEEEDTPPPPPPVEETDDVPPPLLTTTEPAPSGDIAPELPPPNETTPPALEVTPWEPPITGVTHFIGSLSGTSTNVDGTTEALNESVEVFANWLNSTIIGVANDPDFPDMPVLFFGKISGINVANITYFGGSTGGMEVDVVEGTGSGNFGGYIYGLFNMTGSGSDYAIEPFTQPLLSTWDITSQSQEDITRPSTTGTQSWKGYVVGLSENMANIDINRHLMRNANHSDFTMTINKDAGTVAGTLQATDGTFSTNLTIGGGAGNSAFVHENLMGAFLTGTVTHGSTNTLKPHGNYMFSGPLDEQSTRYATWGYWEIAYQNPSTSEQYHNHIPGAMWVAGKPTSSTDLATLAAGNVTGHYSGDIRGSKIITNGMVSEMAGSFQMNVDFAILGSASAFNGTMQLDGHSFNTHSIAGPSDGQFSNGMIDGDGFSGAISGTLYGPSATSIGGNFKTSNGSETYQGIYSGDR